MKPKKIITLITIAAIALTLTTMYVSCNKQIQCQSCNANVKKVTLTYQNSLNTAVFEKTSLNTSKDGLTKAAWANLSSNIYSKVNESMNNLTGQAYQTVQTVLYLDTLINEGVLFAEKNIKAIARINQSGKMLSHTFYLREGNRFTLISELTGNVPNISGNAMEAISNKLVFPGQSKTSILALFDIDNYNFTIKNHVDVLLKKVKTYNPKSSSIGFTSLRDPGDGGGDGCGQAFCNGTGNACQFQSTYYVCYTHTVCFATYISDILKTNSQIPSDSVNQTFDTTLFYGIKRNVLSNSTFGIKYRQYYTDLSTIYSEQATIPIMLTTTRLLSQMNTYFSYLLNNTKQGNQVFLTTAMKNNIMNLITEYKQLYDDDFTEQVFQDVITDLNWAENKTVTEVMTKFS